MKSDDKEFRDRVAKTWGKKKHTADLELVEECLYCGKKVDVIWDAEWYFICLECLDKQKLRKTGGKEQ